MSIGVPRSKRNPNLPGRMYMSEIHPGRSFTKSGVNMPMSTTEIIIGQDIPIGIDDELVHSKMKQTFYEERKAKGTSRLPSWCSCKIIGGIIGCLFAFVMCFIPLDKKNPDIQNTLAVLILMAVLWMTELLPLAVTALIPVILFPLMGVMKASETAEQYFNDSIYFFIISNIYIFSWVYNGISNGTLEITYENCFRNNKIIC